jgi:hypothetical protein
LVSPLVPLGAEDATIAYATRVPLAASKPPLTELQVDVGEAPPLYGSPKLTRRSVVTSGPPRAGVVGSLDVDVELPPADDVHRRDVHLFGSGWYARDGGGAAYLLVHHVVHDRSDLCRLGRPRPPSPPQLRLAARIDARGDTATFTTDRAALGVAWVVAIGDNQPRESVLRDKEKTFRTGPTALDDAYFERGAPAQWLWGLFDTPETARSRAHAIQPGATVYATEPSGSVAEPKERWTLDVRRRTPARFDPIECDH